jgi:hypothetical protein
VAQGGLRWLPPGGHEGPGATLSRDYIHHPVVVRLFEASPNVTEPAGPDRPGSARLITPPTISFGSLDHDHLHSPNTDYTDLSPYHG